MKENRSYMKIIADILRLTAVQNMAQRGHRESEKHGNDGLNRGNFLTILEFMKPYCDVLRKRLDSGKGPANAKYTHHSIQDSLIEIFSELIMEKFVKRFLTQN